MYHFFVEPHQIEGEFISITGTDFNHIANVLRLEQGEEIIISNGQGRDYCCIIESMLETHILCKILSSSSSEQELPTKLYLFQGIPKLDKLEYIIQKSIELGVHEIIPVKMARSIVKIHDDQQNKKIERWQKIAEAAAKQSHRGIVPTIKEPMCMSEAVDYAKQLECIVVPYENVADELKGSEVIRNPKAYGSIGIFIGPEGGYETREIDMLRDMGASTISLGRRILRTETAGIVALSIIMYNLEVV